ncbi:hypothetical protein [Pseudoalteromonas luteoviolacea]|uniref:Lipoprotein n=1 Tax=Pseudoalteromonas luteoviolacea S4054 TaxID=1129367 RepID=A0A0F6A4A1_9GAMM|nr:hypothetical protein [Pseudoalteromonas luteoviolacea]AOT09129.1 hypothetical protein S4054249_15280 [Pseudoalteromonas luteoviolacea]AOT14042.1 hypothetical protein S40542_15250 [Pseudoalteromonas luteoviolacea]AOT18957.1 hypothetical protein S4054_15255 [Pseudoalteromonas luteoviolacea]KKE81025.1 hypothetical protein N479_23880 [Pseudoalteromonas luteoviolacea S4054]KZN70289.1 hypothetical protein N481_02110 [Pseudoalteromonas luteoviolacea S4047-1]
MLLRSRFWVGLSMFALTACQTTKTDPVQSEAKIPCWLQSPVSSHQIGFIGTAAPFSATLNGSLIASRQRAAARLTEYYGFPNVDQEIENLPAEHTQLLLPNGQTLFFSMPYTTSDTLYTYANTQPIDKNKWCKEINCNFSLCEPAWLCSGENNDVIGVSYYTALSHKQLPMTGVNAKALAGYLDQARVNMQEHYFESYSAEHHQTQFSRQGQVTGSVYQQPLLMTKSCRYGATIFANYQIKHTDTKLKTAQNWRKIKQHQGRSIVMGNFGEDGTIAPDNLISSAIKYAIRDALVELAKNKGLTVSASSTLLNENGRYFLSSAHFEIKQIVSGQLVDIQVNYKEGFPVVYVWLLEGKS